MQLLRALFVLAFVSIGSIASAQVSVIEAYCAGQIPNNSQGLVSPQAVKNCINYLTENMSTVPYTGTVSTVYPITAQIVNVSGTVSATYFKGNGSQLTGVIATSVSATTISATNGYFLNVSGTNLVASIITATSVSKNTGLTVSGNINDYFQVNIQNTNSGNSASSDYVATADNGSATTHYVNLGINGSTGGGLPFANANASYLYSTDSEVDIGALGSGGLITFNTSGSVATPTERMRINGSGQVGINTNNPNATLDVAGSISGSSVSATVLNARTASLTTLTVGVCSGCAGAATPGGPSGSIQFNLGNTSISGSTNFVTVNNQVGLGIVAPNAKFDVSGLISSTGVSVIGAATNITTTNLYSANISATVATLSSIGAGSLTASGIVSANVLDSFILSTTAINGSNATLTGGLTAGSIAASGVVSAGTVSGTNLYALNISASGGLLIGTISSTGVVSASSGYANVMHEGVFTQTVSASPTTLNLGLATLISSSITTNTTVAFSGSVPTTAQVVIWKVAQDSTGGRVITWPSNARFSGNIAPTVTTTASTNTVFALTPLPGSANILVTMPATGVSN